MDFLPGMLFVFITDVQKRFVTAQHGGDGLKVSLLVIGGKERPVEIVFRYIVQRHPAPVLSDRNIIGEHLILGVIV